MRDGRAGLGHPAWQRGGGGGGQAEACLGVFKGSERPEAGQPRRISKIKGNGIVDRHVVA